MHQLLRRISAFGFQPKRIRVVVVLVGIAFMCVANFQSYAASDTNETGACTTVLKPLVIQVEFPGTWSSITTRSVKKKFLNELDEYIREMSYGKVCVRGVVTEKWYKLPNPVSHYYVTWQNQQANRSNLRSLVSDSLNAADHDVDVSSYDFVIIALDATFKEWGNNGLAAYPGMLGWRSDESLLTQSGRKVNRGIVVYASTVHLGHVFHDVAHVLGGVKDGNRVLPCLYDQELQSRSSARVGKAAQAARRDAQIHMGEWVCLQPVSRPVAYAHAAAQPFVQVRGLGGDTPRCRSSPVLHRDSPTFVRQLPNTMLEVRERGIQPAQLAPVKMKPRNTHWSIHHDSGHPRSHLERQFVIQIKFPRLKQ